MSGTVRTPADLLANIFPDNTTNAIGADDMRDAVESFAGRVARTISANYTLQLSDRGTVLNVNSTNAPITITIPSGVFAAGNVVGLRQTGTGQIQLVAGSGATLQSFNGQFISRAQNSRLSVMVATPSTFYIDGDLAATGSNAPNAPTGLTSSATSNNSVSLAWTPPATGAVLDHGVYTVQYAPHGGAFTNFSPGVAYCTTNSGSITDSFGNVWAISTAAQAGGGITVNGVYDTPTANVTTLYLTSGTLWQVSAGSWYSFTPSQNYGSTPPASNAWAGPLSVGALWDAGFGSITAWMSHGSHQGSDPWAFGFAYGTAGTGHANGTGFSESDGYWSDPPVDGTSATIALSGTALQLGCIANTGGFQNQNGASAACVSTIINNFIFAGGFTRIFGYYEFSAHLDNVRGLLLHWDIENYSPFSEFDIDIYIDSGGTHHAIARSQSVQFAATTNIDVTATHVYGLNWQSDFVSFYIGGVLIGQTPNPYSGQAFGTYFLVDTATYEVGDGAIASLPAHAFIDYYRIYASIPAAVSPLGEVVTGLSPSTSYDFRVNVSNSGGTSAASAVYTVSTTGSTGQFKVDAVNQRILDPSGAVWKGNGVNLAADNQGWFIGLAAAVTNTTACTPLLSTFPKTKIVRIPCYDIINATSNPANFSSYINGLTAKKVVCSVEFHLTSMNTPTSRTSPTLAQVVSWYGTWAAFYAANPYVWFEIPNEINPYTDGDNGASFLACIKGVVNAVRAHSNTIVQIMLDYGDMSGGLMGQINTDPWWAQQTNLVPNGHFYHGQSGLAGTFTGTTQAQANTWMAGNVTTYQTAFATKDGSLMPVINGEYGDSTDGSNVDANAQVVIVAGTNLNNTPGLVGSTIWYWNAGNSTADLILAAPYDGSALTTSGTTFLNNMF